VARGVVAANAEGRVTLYTGNDDHIVLDLVAPLAVKRGQEEVRLRIRGGRGEGGAERRQKDSAHGVLLVSWCGDGSDARRRVSMS